MVNKNILKKAFSTMINDTLNAIKVQNEADKFGWIVEAK